MGLLNIQQRIRNTSPASKFTALRLRRNVLANSDIGVIVLNKEANGPSYNRVVGTDANFRFFENLDLNVEALTTRVEKVVQNGVDAGMKLVNGAQDRLPKVV